MNSALKSTLWWIFAIIFTVGIAAYQRMTGPTYPAHGSINLNQHEIKYKLIRTAETDKDAPISITVPDTSVSGNIIYKRFKSPDTLSKSAMVRTIDTSWDASFANLWRSIKKEPLTYTLNSDLKFMMPRQPAAGKMEYSVNLTDE